jgi:nicotinate-nucleotide adenylyltransferase
MGGSFDPVHVAHLALAETALAHLQLDEVRWIPVGQAWQKQRTLADGAHRIAMVQAATAHEPRFVVDPIEVQRAGPSYTLDTVRALQAAQGAEPDTAWFLIMGQDQYANLSTWRDWPELLARVTVAVACRGDEPPRPSAELATHPHRVVTLPLPPLHVSSTEIRTRLGRGDDPFSLVPALVSLPVARYIANHQLYAFGPPPLNGHP